MRSAPVLLVCLILWDTIGLQVLQIKTRENYTSETRQVSYFQTGFWPKFIPSQQSRRPQEFKKQPNNICHMYKNHIIALYLYTFVNLPFSISFCTNYQTFVGAGVRWDRVHCMPDPSSRATSAQTRPTTKGHISFCWHCRKPFNKSWTNVMWTSTEWEITNPRTQEHS